MHSKRFLDLLVIGLSALSLAEATFVPARVDVRNVKAIQQRQEADDTPTPAATNSDTKTPAPSPIPSSTPPPPEPSSEPPKPSEPTTPPPQSPTKTTPPPQPTPTSDKPNPTPTTPNQEPPEETTPPAPNQPSPEPPKSSTVKTITVFSTKTNSDGSQSTIASEILTTQPAGLADNSNNNSGSGMTETTRNTVIGVVVGIGGAIVLIGLAFVAWRIWGRKKNQDEGLMDYTTPNDGKSEVGGSMSGRTPFQSTLESYHAPTHVNQAANF
ncbi:hypothetical protein QBC37DRAFT_160221 [Rhypophila decipiens]|uniref:Mid2 domain-containing protein n=1 Tax=Rhypophila decipiens TaxID=261697 RepID=A0AAN7B8C4_9PEZI|nr:hypothetical protein QBC37DRAFT_160221 [Rhypophila decipiens]